MSADDIKPVLTDRQLMDFGIPDIETGRAIERAVLQADRASREPSPKGDAEWIPVDVRLPEWASRDDTPCYLGGKPVGALLRSQKVLVSLDDGGVRVDHLEGIEDSGPPFWATFGKRVVAWKGAPAPFDAARSTPAKGGE